MRFRPGILLRAAVISFLILSTQQLVTFAEDEPLKAARDALSSAQHKQGELSQLLSESAELLSQVKADLTKLETNSVEGMALLTDHVEALGRGSDESQAKLAAAKTSATQIVDTLEGQIKQLREMEEKPEGTDALIGQLEAARRQLSNTISELLIRQKEIPTTLDTVYPATVTLFRRLAAIILPLHDLGADADGDALRQQLAGGFGKFLAQLDPATLVEGKWGSKNTAGTLAHALNGAVDHHDLKTRGSDQAVKGLAAKAEQILKWIPAWLPRVEANGEKQAYGLTTMIGKVTANPTEHQAEASIATGNGRMVESTLNTISRDVQKLADETLVVVTSLLERKALLSHSKKMEKLANIIKHSTNLLDERLTGNFDDFIADQVNLYYFSNVERLMYILNPDTREVQLDEEAEVKWQGTREKLAASNMKLADAQGSVNDLQRRVVVLREELRQARGARNAATSLLTLLNRDNEDLQGKKLKSDAKLTESEKAVAAAPDDEDMVRDRDLAKQRVDQLDRQLIEQGRDRDDARKDKEDADQRTESLELEKSGLPDRIADAERELSRSQGEVRTARAAMQAAALVEVEAFASYRDNVPFLVAPARASSTDPARRVLMYAFADAKTIFIRGLQDDVTKVVGMIASFDVPQPQARIRLWTLEVSGQAGRRRINRLNKVLMDIDKRLADAREETAALLAQLRYQVNLKVNELAKKYCDSTTDGCNTTALRRKARRTFYAAHVQIALDKWVELGVSVPDPAATTTLGESLLVLSLANPKTQDEVLCAIDPKGVKLVALWRAMRGQSTDYTDMNSVCESSPPDVLVTPSQLEILAAIDRVHILDVLESTQALHLEFTSADRKLHELNTRVVQSNAEIATAQGQMTDTQFSDTVEGSALSERRGDLLDEQNATDIIRKALVERLLKNLSILRDRLDLPAFQYLMSVPGPEDETRYSTREARRQSDKQVLSKHTNLTRAKTNARVAAANQMIKELIVAVDEDIERLVVRDLLVELRETISSARGINVGVFKLTSVLATNRRIARIDPQASAQLRASRDQDLLQAAGELAQLVGAAQLGGVTSVLQGLKGAKQDAPPRIYGITTGGVFSITPVIDPSGQALRFELDYVYQNAIREPDKSIDPQLPRIERHTVNTEVQLSNFELREVSRFDSNSRLGVPSSRWGGIPILNQIPGIKEIPLIGWFKRTYGSEAVLQENLILAQTTIYPTIDSMILLLSADHH